MLRQNLIDDVERYKPKFNWQRGSRNYNKKTHQNLIEEASLENKIAVLESRVNLFDLCDGLPVDVRWYL